MSTYIPRHLRGKELAGPTEQAPQGAQAEAGGPLLPTRKRRRWPPVIASILVLLLISGAVTYYVLYTQASEREANRTEAYALLNEAIALIQESDRQTVSLDTAIQTEVTEGNLQERSVLLERVPTALETLGSAEEKAKSALELLTSSEDKELAQNVIASVVNHKDLLTSGEGILTNDISAMNSALLFGQSWELIVAADAELRATAELIRSGSYHEIQEALERNGAVLTNLEQATSLLEQAAKAYEVVDYAPVSRYLSLKIESVKLAVEADQALFAGDAEMLNAKNAEFAAKDTEVVQAAESIPAEPLTLITTAYEARTAEARALYDSARVNAAAADAYIREYVGVETQTAVQ